MYSCNQEMHHNTQHNTKYMETIRFCLYEDEEYIPLIQLLKATHLVGSGSEAQMAVSEGMVLRNGEVELRKRAKITAGERIIFDNFVIEVTKEA